ncbi:MAG: D-3-phosphoglycerate dehydrogenase / 2-oxoglutarate reductase, partial [Gaiellales bacterium]|nr:D-3-phosphoglycerate dehydrogenase / 2-oxoglutarate reductase [Gaiellales bacterium]
ISGGGVTVDAELLAAYPNTRVAITGSTGYDHMDLADLRAAGVAGYCTPDYCTREVADFALACVLAGLRGIVGLDRAMRAGLWRERASGETQRVRGSVLGVIGLGKIGGLVARDASALGMRVLASDPVAGDEAFATAGAGRAELGELLAASDVVTLHAPYVRGSQPLLGATELALLRPGSILVNAARAELLDIDALLRGLVAGRPAWAFMDVWDDEPPLPGDARLDTPNLILTPHAAWYSPQAEEALYARIAEVAAAALRGETARGLIA